MYYYFRGKVTQIFPEKIILELNNTGYCIYVSHPEKYTIGEERIVYIYRHIHEDERYLVGFDDLNEKKMFILLIGVNGLGPKTAISMLKAASAEEIMNAIISNNITFLKRLPNIGSKCAEQIILDLKGKLTGKKGNPNLFNDAYSILKELGYKRKQIQDVLSEIKEPTATTEDVIKIALCKLGKTNV